jgi:hypothetical protein
MVMICTCTRTCMATFHNLARPLHIRKRHKIMQSHGVQLLLILPPYRLRLDLSPLYYQLEPLTGVFGLPVSRKDRILSISSISLPARMVSLKAAM